MPTRNIGDNAAQALDIVTLAIGAGDSVVVKNVAGSTLNYFLNGINGSASTLTATSSATITTPASIQSQGITTVQLTGGQYGAV